MHVCAIVPVKPFNRAKSRLADELSAGQRELLAAGLMRRTLHILQTLPELGAVLVISRDTKALAIARDLGAKTIQESGTPELNTALIRATRAVESWGAEGALIVPADIPLLQAADLREMLHLGRYSNTVVIAPDRHQQGTNLLYVRPPGLIPYSFGDDSFVAHRQAAVDAGATVKIYQSERAALDVDRPDDLALYIGLAQAWDIQVVDIIDSPEWVLAGDRSLST